ncbi:PH domain-containing protein [Mollicutes bacterium LVI A0078]|nr:PH domain-containing protein [Mollicutes bacterium LVI A0075]WOO91465.1 PH domain-containing protein [Mollicutes bacterium LVI A0078]
MKDTFKKFGKDALNSAKNEISSGVETAKKETVSQVSATISNKTDATNNIGEKLVKKATGAGDLLDFKDITTTNNIINSLLLADEKVIYFLESVDEAIAFTNKAIIISNKASMTSSKSQTKRLELNDTLITDVRIETAGTIDRDAEIKFKANDKKFSWDINKTQIELVLNLYISMVNISKHQHIHNAKLENLMSALSTAAVATNVSSNQNKLEDYVSIVEYNQQRLDKSIIIDFEVDYII